MNPLSDLNFSRMRKLPMVAAAEAAECGLACLTMVAGFYGHDVDLNGLRQRFVVSMSGMTMRHMIAIADQLGFASRAVQLDLDGLPRLRLPAIIHWDLKHFVVLKSVKGGQAVVHNPAFGIETYSIESFSKHFTGVALELQPSGSFEKIVARVPVKLSSLWSKMTGFWGAIGKVLALSVALQILAFAVPFQSQLVIDQGILRSDANILVVLAAGFAGLVVLQAVLEALRGWTLQVFEQLLSFQLVGNLFHHLIRLPTDFFEKRQVGDILSRMGSATAIQDIITKGVIAAFIDGAMSVVALAIMFAYSPVLAGIVLLSAAISLMLSSALLPLMRSRMSEKITASAREQTHVMETIRAATTLKVMGREAERESSWRNLYASVINASVSVAKYDICLTSLQTLVPGLEVVVVLFIAANMVIAGRGFSLGMLFAFMAFRQTFSDRTRVLTAQSVQFRLLKLHLERVGDIIAADPEPAGLARCHDAGPGQITLENVSFRYAAGEPFILKNIDLSIEPGEFIAIKGRSGGGKSTLQKVMLGLRAPTEGLIMLDGSPATPELWRTWRQSVGVVAQDDRLLSGSIADNIAFFDPDLDTRDVEEAARAAEIHTDILRMPMQYYSPIGDMGSSLSGGQRQRILLARALYRKPKILFLDEGTANLDDQTEEMITELVAGLSMTRITIAHRPAMLRRADRIYSMEAGRLTELPYGRERKSANDLPNRFGEIGSSVDLIT